jgi:GT2 family glycosyltransferase
MREPMTRRRAYFYMVVTRRRVLYRMFHASRPVRALARRWIGRVDPRPASHAGAAAIYAPHGAAVFLHPRFFARGGTIHYRGFMYGEEIHIAEQARSCGLEVVMAPDLRIEHEGSFTTGTLTCERRRRWQQDSSRIAWEDYFASV